MREPAPGRPAGPRHWLTLFDPDDGEPYGELCTCPIGKDHLPDGTLNGLEDGSS